MSNEERIAEIPFFVHEADMARLERPNTSLFIAVLVLILALIGTNYAWITYENSFQDIVVTQDSLDGNNNYIGEDGDIVNY